MFTVVHLMQQKIDLTIIVVKTYLLDDGNSDKKAKGTKTYVIKKLKFNDYKNCLLKTEIVSKSQEIFKTELHNVYTKDIHKIARSSNDDKRLRTFDKTTAYSYG